jgi:hypothetical protein
LSKKIPNYAIEPLMRCKDSLLYALKMLKLCVDGISIITRRPQMTQRIIDLTVQVGEEVTPKLKSELKNATEEANFAENELQNGFPFLNAHALVGAWGSLEAAVEDMLVNILVNEPKSLEKEEFAKIRVPLPKFEALDKEDRMRFLLGEVQRARAVGIVQGVDAFEKSLQPFGLTGMVDEDSKKMLWEMNHLRNVIVHRDSLADVHLVQACPWLNLKLGDRVLVNDEKYGLCSDAVFEYLKILARRLAERYGALPPPWALRPRMVYLPSSPGVGDHQPES